MKTVYYSFLMAMLAFSINILIAEDIAAIKEDREKARGEVVKEFAGRLRSIDSNTVERLKALQAEVGDDNNLNLLLQHEIDGILKEEQAYTTSSLAAIYAWETVNSVREGEKLKFKKLQSDFLQRVTDTGQPTPETKTPPRLPQAKPAKTNAVAVSEAKPSSSNKTLHAAVGATVEVSSTHLGEPGEGDASALVDGDLFTRWSSEYLEPQQVIINLKTPVKIDLIRLHWEKASAIRYCVYGSSDRGKTWTSIYLYMYSSPGIPDSRIDEIHVNGMELTSLKLDLKNCINKDWGFSLYEVEVVATDD